MNWRKDRAAKRARHDHHDRCQSEYGTAPFYHHILIPLGFDHNIEETMPATVAYREQAEKPDGSRYEMIAWQVPENEEFPQGLK